MWKAIVLSAVIFTLLLIEALPTTADDIEDYIAVCEKGCKHFGGTPVFDEVHIRCTCKPDEKTDDHQASRKKRHIGGSDNIVGQQLQPVILPSRPLPLPFKRQIQLPPVIPRNQLPILPPNGPIILPPNRPLIPPPNVPILVPPKALPIVPITQPDALRSLTDIRQRVNNLARNPTGINNEAINAIRASLRNLAQQINILGPEQRARIATNRARTAQHIKTRLNTMRVAGGGKLLPLRPGLVGSVANNTSPTLPTHEQLKKHDLTNNTSEESTHQIDESAEEEAQNSQKAIITQPKDLIDD